MEDRLGTIMVLAGRLSSCALDGGMWYGPRRGLPVGVPPLEITTEEGR